MRKLQKFDIKPLEAAIAILVGSKNKFWQWHADNRVKKR